MERYVKDPLYGEFVLLTRDEFIRLLRQRGLDDAIDEFEDVPWICYPTEGWINGHKVVWVEEVFDFVYDDTHEIVSDLVGLPRERPCKACGEKRTGDNDPCLGTLTGIVGACCGHGITEDAYVMFEDQTVVYGAEALEVLARMKS